MRQIPRGIWVLLSANVVIALGYGFIAPALPSFARAFNVSFTAATAVVSAFAVMRLLFAPAGGRLVSVFGERRIYLTGLLIVAASTLACAFAQTYWQLLIFRGLGGIGSTMFSFSAMALLIRMAPSDIRGRVSGFFSAGFLIGSITGPLIGAALVEFGLRVPFVVYAVALLVASTVVATQLREVIAPDQAEGPTAGLIGFRTALRDSAYRAILGTDDRRFDRRPAIIHDNAFAAVLGLSLDDDSGGRQLADEHSQRNYQSRDPSRRSRHHEFRQGT